jgi:hypothetical protein
MILSVLSSPALVSGLMVVRAKNPVHSVLFLILVFRDTSGLLLLLGLDFFAMIFPVGFFMNLVTIAIFRWGAGRLQIGKSFSALTISVGSQFFFFALFLTMRPLVRLAVSFFYLYLFSKVLDTWSFHILSGAQLAFNSNTSLEWSGTISSSTAQGPADIEATVPAEVPAQAQAAARLEAQAQAQAQLLAALSPLQREALAQIAEGEIELFARIRLLEAELAYRLPPQLNAGEYEQLVKENLRESAFTVSSYLSAVQNELFDVQVMELKAALQERLFSLLLAEPDLKTILQEAPDENIRSQAYEFIEEQVESFNDMRTSFDKTVLQSTLNDFINDLNRNGANALVYKAFLAYFKGG